MTTGLPSVEKALAQVAEWKTAQLTENQTKIEEVDGELSKLQAQLANLQAQLESLRQVRGQLEAVDLGQSVLTRSYEAIFSALSKQADSAAKRATALAAAEEARQNKAFADLAAGELSPLVEEYRQFKDQVEPTLAALPESYRGAIRQHHQGVSEKIRTALTRVLDGPTAVQADWIDLELVVGIDAPDSAPEVLICVLPIHDIAFTQWTERPTDLTTHIGARVAQSIYEAAKRAGPPGAQAIRGGHQGLLAMEVDLEGATAEFPTVLLDTLRAVLGSAPELAAAKVRVAPRRVDFDYLLPPEDHAEEA